jgi:hypothetical protein
MLCCEVLEKVRDVATQNLSGKNLEVFLTEIGVAFHRYHLSLFKLIVVEDHTSQCFARAPAEVPSQCDWWIDACQVCGLIQ